MPLPANAAQSCATDSLALSWHRNVKGFLRSQPDANIISVSQNDNGNYCQTPEEKAIMDEEGSPMGPLLRAGECTYAAWAPTAPVTLTDTAGAQ